MELSPPDVQIDHDTLTIAGEPIGAGDVTELTYWARERRSRRGKVKELTHKFHLQLGKSSRRFDVRVQPHTRDVAVRQAKLAASIVQWLQDEVEGRLREEQIERVRAGEVIRVGDLVLNRIGFGEHSVFHADGPELEWSRFRRAHVSLDSIDVILNVAGKDGGNEGLYAFSVRRSVLNSVMLPEILAAVKDLSTAT